MNNLKVDDEAIEPPSPLPWLVANLLNLLTGRVIFWYLKNS